MIPEVVVLILLGFIPNNSKIITTILVYAVSITYVIECALAIASFLSSVSYRVNISDRPIHFKRFIAPIFWGIPKRERQQDPKKVLESVGKLLANLFGDVNLCASDIVTGLILVKQQHNRQTAVDQELQPSGNDTIIPSPNSVGAASMIGRAVDSMDQTDPIFHIPTIIYLCQYAEAMYGIPLFLFSDPRNGTQFMCCPTTNQQAETPAQVIEKTMETGCKTILCCFPTTWLSPPLHHPDLVYKSVQGEFFKSPFAVSIDRKVNAIVISVRGTLSTTDLLVDLFLDEQRIEMPTSKDSITEGLVHGGMYKIAETIFNELEEHRVFSIATSSMYSAFKVVVLGHSLGAGGTLLID